MSNNKKVAILTFHRAINYGAVIQCFALFTKLSKFFDVSVLDYRCRKIEKAYYSKGDSFFQRLKHLIRSILFLKQTKATVKKKKRFKKFLKLYIALTKPYSNKNIAQSNSCFDSFIVGSDQVWNFRITGNDITYFLPFVENNKIKLSYAASFGSSLENDLETGNVFKLLDSFNGISIRESGQRDALQKYISKTISVDCDPVMLLSKDEWINSLGLKKSNRNKYVLIYLIAKDSLCVEKAIEFAKSHDLIPIFLCSYEWNVLKDKNVLLVKDAGPIQFLELIYNATAVFTTSFHATVLSMIFNIPFFYELNKNKNNSNSRFFELVKNFEIENREIDENTIYNLNNINWTSINKRINDISKRSFERLLGELNRK